MVNSFKVLRQLWPDRKLDAADRATLNGDHTVGAELLRCLHLAERMEMLVQQWCAEFSSAFDDAAIAKRGQAGGNAC